MEHYSSTWRTFAPACLILLVASGVHAQTTILGSSAAGTIGTRVGRGNAVNLAFDTGLIGIGVPDGWGSTCIAFQVGARAPDGAAIFFIANTPAGVTNGFERSFEALFPSSTTRLANNTIVSLAVAKTAGAVDIEDPSSLIVWRLHLMRNGSGNYRFLLVVDDTGGGVPYEWNTNVSFDTTYKLYVKYDLVNDVFEAKVNGETFATGTITAAHRQTIGHLIMGSSASSTGRDIMFLIDRIEHTPISRP